MDLESTQLSLFTRQASLLFFQDAKLSSILVYLKQDVDLLSLPPPPMLSKNAVAVFRPGTLRLRWYRVLYLDRSVGSNCFDRIQSRTSYEKSS